VRPALSNASGARYCHASEDAGSLPRSESGESDDITRTRTTSPAAAVSAVPATTQKRRATAATRAEQAIAFAWLVWTRKSGAISYLNSMPKRLFEPCIPARGIKVPAGPDWIHEIKHDGYRLIVQREDKRVRLFTRNGHDWTDRYPLIVEAALKNRSSSFVIDGEAVLLGIDGVSDFDGLHSRQHDDEVQLYAFDALMLDGDDLRKLPLSIRKANLARLLARRPEGIFVSDFEQGEIGPDLFRKACEFGLEGLVSKHRDRAYRPGRSPNWLKVKNPKHPAMTRVVKAFA
jgi:bifunctional non-homologous end joining protein LigD